MFDWLKLLWHTTNLRVVILFSLFLQTFLFFSAPLRKRTSNSLITIPMWLAYNLADATAIFGVGLISKPCGNALGAYANPELVALWAPFFLLHLGGPDTITAFALEDNELWLRHLLQLVVQLTTSAYVFIHTLSSNNQFWLPTLLMFISALIKTAERNRSLYLASWHRFRDSMIRERKPNSGPNYPNYRKLFSNYESGLPLRPEVVEAPNPETSVGDNNEPHLIMGAEFEINLLESVYLHFGTVKGLIADLKFSSREREKSRSVFLKMTPQKAFESVMIELNFLYDILFTKTPVLRGYFGFIPSRFVSSSSCLAAFVLFHLMDPKHKFSHHKIDVEITYTLLLAAIVKDLIAFFVISTSDWASVSWNEFKYKPALHSQFTAFLFRLWSICYQTGFTMKAVLFKFIMPAIMKRRWSESIFQFNFIFYSLHPRSKMWDKIIDYLGLTNILDRWKYVKTKRFEDLFRDFIFEELKIKSEEAVHIKTAKDLRSAKGNWVLSLKPDWHSLLPYTLDADYDKILILWHIATELCYNTENTEEGNSDQIRKFRKISKVLSDYMLYLLIMEPSMMSAVAGTAQIRFRDTCAEAKLFFQDKRVVLERKEKYSCLNNMNSSCLDTCLDTCCDHNCMTQRNEYCRSNLCYSGHKDVMIQACNNILDVHTNLNPSTVGGDTSKTVLFEACILTKELKKLDKDKWEILSKVWVELLSYAAYRCDANNHATYLSKGGQLISLIWLLMVHLGLGDRFEVSP